MREAVTNVERGVPPRRAAGHVGAAKARFPCRQLPWHGSGDCSRARVRGFAVPALFHRINSFQRFEHRSRFVAEHICTTLEEMPGAYTRSKLAAEQRALEAAASGFPVVIASPTMPIGNDPNLTPPASMLQYFMSRRIQFYLDFVLNLVDVHDVAEGLMLAMQRGRSGERYVLGGENISLKKLLAILGV